MGKGGGGITQHAGGEEQPWGAAGRRQRQRLGGMLSLVETKRLAGMLVSPPPSHPTHLPLKLCSPLLVEAPSNDAPHGAIFLGTKGVGDYPYMYSLKPILR